MLDSRYLKIAALLSLAAGIGYILIPGLVYLVRPGAFGG